MMVHAAPCSPTLVSLGAAYTAIPLKNDTLHLWTLRSDTLEPFAASHLSRALLSPDEQLDSRRYRLPVDERQFILTRALLRLALSNLAPVAPVRWQFGRSRFGKPLVIAPTIPLFFSISHAQGIIAILASHVCREIGVDVELLRHTADLAAIAPQYFSREECAALNTLADESWTRRFFDLWTLKEAYAKALGLGLNLPFTQISFDLRTPWPTLTSSSSPGWFFTRLQPTPAHTLAIAVNLSEQ
jgi:4'-phosphopantetheinyl transferase